MRKNRLKMGYAFLAAALCGVMLATGCSAVNTNTPAAGQTAAADNSAVGDAAEANAGVDGAAADSPADTVAGAAADNPAVSDTDAAADGSVDADAAYVPQDHGFGQIGAFSTTDLGGDNVTEAVFAQKPVTFINYWATWCGPCRSELPDFQAMYDKYKDSVTFVTIIDDGANNSTAAKLAGQYLKDFANILPVDDLLKPIQSGYVPTSVIVDQGGYLLVDKIIGAVGDYSSYIDAALKIVGK